MGEPEVSRGVEGVRDRETVVDDVEHDQTCPRADGSERIVKTNTPCRRNRPGGHVGEPKASRDVESNWDRRSDGEGDRISGRRCQKDGATSGAHRDSKQVERRPLATEEACQQRRYGRCVKNVPRSSMAPSKHPRHPIALPNPPRRRGRLKMRPRKIRRTKMRRLTYQVRRRRRGQSRRIKRIGDVTYEIGKIPAQHDTAEVEDSRSCALSITRAATYHIWTPLDAAAHGR